MVSPAGSVKRFKMHCILRSPLATRAPTSFCTSGYRRALLANAIYGVSKQTGFCKNRRVYIHLLCLLFCKFSRWQARRFSQVWPHLICLLFVLSIIASAIFRMEIGGNRRLVCPKAKRTDGSQWRRSRSSRPLTASVCFATQIMILNEAKEA